MEKIGIPITITVNQKYSKEIVQIIASCIINYDEWINGMDKYLKYRIGEHITENLHVKIEK